jgi:hypothetical protein
MLMSKGLAITLLELPEEVEVSFRSKDIGLEITVLYLEEDKQPVTYRQTLFSELCDEYFIRCEIKNMLAKVTKYRRKTYE